jgi:PTH1 family peptidyl-tRNA hydrolase
MILIVGLGNPGNKYKDTRHNIGFKIIDEVHNYYDFPPFKKKFDGLYSKKKIFEQNIVIFKPTSSMNVCGEPILNIFNFFKIKNNEDLIVFHDDLDMDFSKIRVKSSGSHGGHNGIRNIIKYFGDEFYRIKFGIKNNSFTKKKIKAEIFVLEKFSNSESFLVNQLKREIAKNLNFVIKKKQSLFINNLPKN